MRTFSEIFSKFNPLEKNPNHIVVDLDNPSLAVELILDMGRDEERARIYKAVMELDVDSFDDLVYKSEIIEIIEAGS